MPVWGQGMPSRDREHTATVPSALIWVDARMFLVIFGAFKFFEPRREVVCVLGVLRM